MKIGVIGLGSIGMRHLKNLRAMGHWVNGYDPIMARRLTSNGVLYGVDELCEVADAIVVASPTVSHYADIISAYHAHKPTFVEKPISYSKQDRGYSEVRMVGYNLRFHGSVKQAKAWLDEGRIGKPVWANFTCAQFSDKPPYLRDGVILNWSHEIDLALYLLGEAWVEGSSTRIVDGHDDMTDILLTHAGGCRTTIHLDYHTTPEIRTFVILGESGKITVSLPQRNAFLVANGKDQSDWIHCRKSYDDDYKEEMAAFVARVGGKDTLGCTKDEALKTLDICLEVRRRAGL